MYTNCHSNKLHCFLKHANFIHYTLKTVLNGCGSTGLHLFAWSSTYCWHKLNF